MASMDSHHHTNPHDNSPPPPPEIPAYMKQPSQPPTYPRRNRERTPRHKRNPLLIPLIAVSVLAVVMSVLYGSTFIDRSSPEAAFDEAVELCVEEESSPYISVHDEGTSLIMTSEGTESAGAPIEDIACVFLFLEVPTSIINRFDTTRALDGTQSGTWDQF